MSAGRTVNAGAAETLKSTRAPMSAAALPPAPAPAKSTCGTRAGWAGSPGAQADDQLAVPVGTVRRLVAKQTPTWAGLDVREVRSAATVNAIFWVGDDVAARFPLRSEDLRDLSVTDGRWGIEAVQP